MLLFHGNQKEFLRLMESIAALSIDSNRKKCSTSHAEEEKIPR